MAARLSRLVLEEPIAVPDGGGGQSVSWEEVGVLWGRLVTASGAEAVTADRRAASIRRRIEIRREPGAVRRPRPDQRLRLGARVFAIRAVAESPSGAGLILWVEEGPFS